jgi:hypothetical protein
MDDRMNELIAAHPRIFRGEGPVIASHLPTGWYTLVDRLSSDIESLLGDRSETFVVMQIKEKFGTLRLIYAFENADESSPDSDWESTLERLRALVDEAGERSTHLCQRCGDPARLQSHEGWVATLCDRHAPKQP